MGKSRPDARTRICRHLGLDGPSGQHNHSIIRRKDDMPTITIDLAPDIYKQLAAQAQQTEQTPELLSRALLETALQAQEASQSPMVRDALHATGRLRPLSATLRRKIIPGVTLDEVRTILTQAAGPSLSDIIQEQRGTKP
jgi:hypothetical protein